MTDAAGRSQDQGRRHRRSGKPSAATSTLLARYQQAMRDELTGLLDELGAMADPGLGLETPARKITSTTERARLWELAIRLGRELGTEVDPTPPADPASARPVAARPRRRRVDYGGA